MTTHDRPLQQQLASDNYAGLCPEALAALEQANQGHAPSYGQDRWTAEACDQFRALFETPCEGFFVFNGTAANALALASLCQSYHSIVCHRYAHIETDECGAPEFFSHGSQAAAGRRRPINIWTAVRRRWSASGAWTPFSRARATCS